MQIPVPIVFGEVLFDHFPDGSRVLGGAPFNVAWHLQALGAAPLFIGRVGSDAEGNEIRQRMDGWGLRRDGLQRDFLRPTGQVSVTLDHKGSPDFHIVGDQAYDYIDSEAFPDLPQAADLIYHGTLAIRDSVSLDALKRLKQTTGASSFIDVNLRPPWWKQSAVISQMQEARWVKINDEELDRLFPGHDDSLALAVRVRRELSLELLVVTRGSHGAIVVDENDCCHRVTPEADITVVDTVGAGDAFAAMIIMGLLRRWPLATTMARAQRFASAIVAQRGAIMENPSDYANFLT